MEWLHTHSYLPTVRLAIAIALALALHPMKMSSYALDVKICSPVMVFFFTLCRRATVDSP